MYLQEKLCAGQTLEGPAIIIDKNRCECMRVLTCVCVASYSGNLVTSLGGFIANNLLMEGLTK